ncbi:MAG TPA: ribonuclease HII [Gammaproteobacteria bacterium]|nr:ribonuclease HII [Gammaproteobacteria bacterium]
MAEQLAMVWNGTVPAVAGVDEAGRGPLAGPVVAAAVILDDSRPISGLRDSKVLTAVQRRELSRCIRRNARAWAVALAQPAEIDTLNILQASLLAMERAVAKLTVAPTVVRIDGSHAPRFAGAEPRFEVEAVIDGDASIAAISAASILAKVCRDRLMRAWHRQYPVYGFAQHKGYPTRGHLSALAAHGPCPIHRRSFGPVREALGEVGP